VPANRPFGSHRQRSAISGHPLSKISGPTDLTTKFLPLKIIFDLDSICPTPFVKVFTVMKNCEQLWLVSGLAEIYQNSIQFRLKGNV
jgi:hypothetical protein